MQKFCNTDPESLTPALQKPVVKSHCHFPRNMVFFFQTAPSAKAILREMRLQKWIIKSYLT